MIEIRLTKGQVALVDTEDSDLAEFKWCASFKSNYGDNGAYIAVRGIKAKKKSITIRMHCIVMARMLGRLFLFPNEEVDHIDLNPLNNRRSNLRLTSHQQNSANRRKPISNTSGFKGVCWDKQTNKWQAKIGVNNKQKYLGRFDTPEEAYAAYCKAAEELHGEFARVE